MRTYANRVGIGVAEMARIDFIEEFDGKQEIVSSVVVHVEVLRNMAQTINQTIREFEESLAKQKEENNKLI